MTEEQKWEAWSNKDKAYDGVFFAAVKTTGIFCRPSCPSRPQQKNVIFFDTVNEAVAAGFRPCKRCRPDLLEYEPIRELAEETKQLIERHYAEKMELEDKLRNLGVTQHRMIEIFKKEYGVTINEYTNSLRLLKAKAKLKETDEPIIHIAYATGFGSLSAFYRFFRKYEGMTPADFRKSDVLK